MSDNAYKFAGAVLLLGSWFGLVLTGKVPPDGFVEAITGALTGLGIYHVATPRKDAS